MANKDSVGRRVMGAGAWTVGTRLGAKLIDLFLLLCLARLLGPEDFGLVAIAMAVVSVVEALFEMPTTSALIRVPVLTAEQLDTAFTISLLRGFAVAFLLLLLAWPLARFSGDARLTELVVVLAIAPASRGLASPRMVEFARNFNFKPDAMVELTGKLTAMLIAITIAVATGSYWAIAAATICTPLISSTLSYFIAPLSPRLTLSEWKFFSNLVGWNFVSQFFSALNWQIDRLLLPRLVSVVEFGNYAMGKQISELPFQALIQPVTRPAMAALAIADEKRASRYLQMLHGIAAIMIPLMLVPISWPEILIKIALGPSWSGAAVWLRWLSVVSLLALPALLMAPLAMTLDRTRLIAVRTCIELFVRLPLVWFGAVFFSVAGAIAGSAIATAAGVVSALLIIKKISGITLIAQAKAVFTPCLAVLPAILILTGTQPWLLSITSKAELFFTVAAIAGAYVFSYAIVLTIFWILQGKPAGLEHHVFGLLSRVAARYIGRRNTENV